MTCKEAVCKQYKLNLQYVQITSCKRREFHVLKLIRLNLSVQYSWNFTYTDPRKNDSNPLHWEDREYKYTICLIFIQKMFIRVLGKNRKYSVIKDCLWKNFSSSLFTLLRISYIICVPVYDTVFIDHGTTILHFHRKHEYFLRILGAQQIDFFFIRINKNLNFSDWFNSLNAYRVSSLKMKGNNSLLLINISLGNVCKNIKISNFFANYWNIQFLHCFIFVYTVTDFQ